MYQYIFTGSNWKTCITFSLPFMALGKGKKIKNVLVTPNTVCTYKNRKKMVQVGNVIYNMQQKLSNNTGEQQSFYSNYIESIGIQRHLQIDITRILLKTY